MKLVLDKNLKTNLPKTTVLQKNFLRQTNPTSHSQLCMNAEGHVNHHCETKWTLKKKREL